MPTETLKYLNTDSAAIKVVCTKDGRPLKVIERFSPEDTANYEGDDINEFDEFADIDCGLIEHSLASFQRSERNNSSLYDVLNN